MALGRGLESLIPQKGTKKFLLQKNKLAFLFQQRMLPQPQGKRVFLY